MLLNFFLVTLSLYHCCNIHIILPCFPIDDGLCNASWFMLIIGFYFIYFMFQTNDCTIYNIYLFFPSRSAITIPYMLKTSKCKPLVQTCLLKHQQNNTSALIFLSSSMNPLKKERILHFGPKYYFLCISILLNNSDASTQSSTPPTCFDSSLHSVSETHLLFLL